MKQRVLFICHGNICRSPMAEFMLKKLVNDAGRGADFEIDSAATSTEEIGNDIYPPAKRCLQRHGIPYVKHAARQVTRADLEHFDHIFVMDNSNICWLRTLFGTEACRRVRLLMSLTGRERDVADPWYTGDFERTYRDLSEALPHLLTPQYSV